MHRVKGPEFRQIREELGLTPNEFAIELGYRGNERNNDALIDRYENGSRQIPLTVASLAWLILEWVVLARAYTGHKDIELPDWPEWEGYELELKPLNDDPAGGPPAPNESSYS